MSDKERKISDGSAAILVKDRSLAELQSNAPFYQWLKEEGFEGWGRKGFFSGVDWIFININSKIMAPGMPGIGITYPFGNHAVTIDEFKTIYNIYKKYEGLSVLKQSKEEQKRWEKQLEEAEAAEKKYWEEMTFEKYWNEILEMLPNHIPASPKQALAYMKEEEDLIREWYEAKRYPSSIMECLYLMY